MLGHLVPEIGGAKHPSRPGTVPVGDESGEVLQSIFKSTDFTFMAHNPRGPVQAVGSVRSAPSMSSQTKDALPSRVANCSASMNVHRVISPISPMASTWNARRLKPTRPPFTIMVEDDGRRSRVAESLFRLEGDELASAQEAIYQRTSIYGMRWNSSIDFLNQTFTAHPSKTRSHISFFSSYISLLPTMHVSLRGASHVIRRWSALRHAAEGFHPCFHPCFLPCFRPRFHPCPHPGRGFPSRSSASLSTSTLDDGVISIYCPGHDGSLKPL